MSSYTPPQLCFDLVDKVLYEVGVARKNKEYRDRYDNFLNGLSSFYMETDWEAKYGTFTEWLTEMNSDKLMDWSCCCDYEYPESLFGLKKDYITECREGREASWEEAWGSDNSTY
tara:strand:+ start:159 stop:503 length:345 start_codon:yes stop_codon:yes gene_type:complete